MTAIKQGIYLHYKGNLYVVITTATHTESGETLVVYHSKSNKQEIWARPASMFCDYVTLHQREIPRFKFIRSTP